MLSFAERANSSHEITISVTRFLLTFAIAACSGSALVWFFVRYWLFAR